MTNFASHRVGIVKNVSNAAITIELPDTGAYIEWPVSEDSSPDLEPGESVSLQLMKVMKDITAPEMHKADEDAARKRQLLEQLLN